MLTLKSVITTVDAAVRAVIEVLPVVDTAEALNDTFPLVEALSEQELIAIAIKTKIEIFFIIVIFKKAKYICIYFY
jgi:hypothetical protein